MSTFETLDRPPAGFFPLRVMREQWRKWDWVVLMIDVHPDEFRLGEGRKAREAWVRIPGKHRNRDAAWAALENIIATRH